MQHDIASISEPEKRDLVTYSLHTGDDETLVGNDVNIHSITIKKEVNKIPFARIKILDGDTAAAEFKVSNTDQFIPGEKIQIAMGYHGEDTLFFKGIIISHSNRVNNNCAETIIECKDETVKMTITPHNKHFNNQTDSDIAEDLIKKYGLSPEVENTSILRPDLVQQNLTDWDFMVSNMDRIGRITCVSDGTVSIKTPNIKEPTDLEVRYGQNILEFHANIDARYQVNHIKVSSWNFQKQEIETTEADHAGFTEGDSSYDSLDAINSLDISMRSAGRMNEEERQAIANARKLRNKLAMIQGSIKILGNRNLHQGDLLRLKGVGDRFKEPAFISAIKHEYTDGDWTTELTLGMSSEWFATKASGNQAVSSSFMPGGGTPSGSTSANAGTGLFSTLQGLQIGIVTDLADPEDEFRVRIKLPAINSEEEGIWARVANLDAGDHRGTYFAPEINDEVIVGFINGDPSLAVILGMLYSSAHPSPISPSTENNLKGYQSREGLKLFFDDEEKAIKIETPAGKRVILSEDQGEIKIEDENNNSMTMDSSGIAVKSSKDLIIEAAGALTLKGNKVSIHSNTNFEIEAISASMNGSGSTEIKGGIVKIN